MFKKILGDLNLDLFREILLVFIKFYYQITTKQRKRENNYLAILLKETFSTIINLVSLIPVTFN